MINTTASDKPINIHKQPSWTLHEAVILLDGYLETLKGEKPRLRIIKRISEDLRKMAVNKNIIIDSIYRNENGISFQIQRIESACLGYMAKGKPATKLFGSTVDIYNNDRQQYDIILKEAQAMIEGVKTIKESFVAAEGKQIAELSRNHDSSHNLGLDNEILPIKPGHEATLLDPGLLAAIEIILQQYFLHGYRCGDSIALDMFRSYFADTHGVHPKCDDFTLERHIKACGVEYNGLIYCPDIIMDDFMYQKVIASIERYFAQGITVVFFESLFNEFADEFLDYNVFDTAMLKAYLTFRNIGRHYIEDNCIKQHKEATLDPVTEVEGILLHTGRPMDIQDIIDKLSYIPEGNIRSIFYTDENIMSGGRGIVFHIDTFSITSDDLDDIAEIIRNLITEKEYTTLAELLRTLRLNHPHILENNTYFRDTGFRNAIEYHLKSKFAFNNNVITALGSVLSVKDLFINYAKQRGYFTKDELHDFACSLGSQVYFDAVNTVSMRINNTNYVPNEDARFDVMATDNAISMYCVGDYIPINVVDSFILFPSSGYPWNSFLLESYVAKFSEKFKLVHMNFTEDSTAGVVVRKASKYTDLTSIVTDELAYSNCVLKKVPALEYLVERGFITSRRWDHMEEFLDEAQILRNRKG